MRFGLPVIATGSLAMAAASVYYAAYAVRSQWLGRTYWHGRRDTDAVALTFDDGPSPDTENILDVLAEHGVNRVASRDGAVKIQKENRFLQLSHK